ncbi:hypothetical protein [Pendulispora albinea]|uniref:Tetratricopeptide repeat protein n=1 Tax=Pendulispora albinea TaxID=2741071 RepID=A0ABZ2MC12_9BACT
MAAMVCTLCAMAIDPGAAHAQTPPPAGDRASARASARELGERGFKALDRGEWRVAETLFRRAETFYHASSLLLGLARAEAQLGDVVAATEHYQRIIDEGPMPEANPVMIKAVESAKREIGPVKARCARVVVRVTGLTARAPAAAPVVTLDETGLPGDALGGERLVNPGTHHIAVRVEGEGAAETSVTVAEGESREVSLTLTREPTETAEAQAPSPIVPSSPPPRTHDPSSMQRTLGIAALGLGGAALVTGTISGILALGVKSSLSGSPCATGAAGCNRAALDSYQDDLSRYHTTTAIATVGFGVAAAGGIAGAILLLTAPSHPSNASSGRATILPYAGADGIGAVGRF